MRRRSAILAEARARGLGRSTPKKRLRARTMPPHVRSEARRHAATFQTNMTMSGSRNTCRMLIWEGRLDPGESARRPLLTSESTRTAFLAPQPRRLLRLRPRLLRLRQMHPMQSVQRSTAMGKMARVRCLAPVRDQSRAMIAPRRQGEFKPNHRRCSHPPKLLSSVRSRRLT